MVKTRPGFTLTELLIAVTLLAVVGAAVTGLFVTQSRFFDKQQKLQMARSVTRSATNMMMSELRMLERDSAVVAATNSSITVRVPYAFGIVCATPVGGVQFSQIPVDSLVYAQATIAGYAIRSAAGVYTYRATNSAPTVVANTACTNVGISIVPGGRALQVSPTATADKGQAIFLYHIVRYYFANSSSVPGRTGLFRELVGTSTNEEIVAPFDTTAKFRFFVSDRDTAQTGVPSDLRTLTGFELVLDGVSENPNANGTYTNVPSRTAIFFKNR